MAHSVEVNIMSHPLSREENGIVFVVADNAGRFGELTISKGGVRLRGGALPRQTLLQYGPLPAARA